jgi:hypothetical protein
MPYFRTSVCESRNRLLPALLLVALFSLVPVFSLARVPNSPLLAQQKEAQETWLGMYMGARKIGYTQIRIAPTTYKGKPAQ